MTLSMLPREYYQGLKPKPDGLMKNIDVESGLRTVHFDPEYIHYDPSTDENLVVLRANAGRDVELCQKPCTSHEKPQRIKEHYLGYTF